MSRPRNRSLPPPPAYMPGPAVIAWNRLLQEMTASLVDDGKSRLGINDLVEVLRAPGYPWPTRGLSDEYLVAAWLRLCLAWGCAGPGRRGWMRRQLAEMIEVIEGLVDDATADGRRATAARKNHGAVALAYGVASLPPAPPAEGEPGFRRDIDG